MEHLCRNCKFYWLIRTRWRSHRRSCLLIGRFRNNKNQISAILSRIKGQIYCLHECSPCVWRPYRKRRGGEAVSEGSFAIAEVRMRDAYAELVEATRFVAGLAGCDGAIVLSEDLRLFGFGAEIRAEL